MSYARAGFREARAAAALAEAPLLPLPLSLLFTPSSHCRNAMPLGPTWTGVLRGSIHSLTLLLSSGHLPAGCCFLGGAGGLRWVVRGATPASSQPMMNSSISGLVPLPPQESHSVLPVPSHSPQLTLPPPLHVSHVT